MARTLEERFWAKVDKNPGHGPNGDCWVWTGAKAKDGYGQFWLFPYMRSAHRVSALLCGEIQDLHIPRVIMHSCDNRPCVRPEHLKAGSYAENNHDMIAKNRHTKGEESPHAKLTEPGVKAILALNQLAGLSRLQIAKITGLSDRMIGKICNGESWKHITLPEVSPDA